MIKFSLSLFYFWILPVMDIDISLKCRYVLLLTPSKIFSLHLPVLIAVSYLFIYCEIREDKNWKFQHNRMSKAVTLVSGGQTIPKYLMFSEKKIFKHNSDLEYMFIILLLPAEKFKHGRVCMWYTIFDLSKHLHLISTPLSYTSFSWSHTQFATLEQFQLSLILWTIINIKKLSIMYNSKEYLETKTCWPWIHS